MASFPTDSMLTAGDKYSWFTHFMVAEFVVDNRYNTVLLQLTGSGDSR